MRITWIVIVMSFFLSDDDGDSEENPFNIYISELLQNKPEKFMSKVQMKLVHRKQFLQQQISFISKRKIPKREDDAKYLKSDG